MIDESISALFVLGCDFERLFRQGEMGNGETPVGFSGTAETPQRGNTPMAPLRRESLPQSDTSRRRRTFFQLEEAQRPPHGKRLVSPLPLPHHKSLEIEFPTILPDY